MTPSDQMSARASTLLVERIAQLEKIEITDKDIQERIDNIARAAGERAKSVRDYYSRPDARDDLSAQLMFDRTVSYLFERAKIKEIDATPSKVDEEGEKS